MAISGVPWIKVLYTATSPLERSTAMSSGWLAPAARKAVQNLPQREKAGVQLRHVFDRDFDPQVLHNVSPPF